MTLRSHYTPDQHRAAQILDGVRAGLVTPQYEILWALSVLGEPI